MMEVNGATRSHAANVLFLMGLALLAGYFLVATCSGWLTRRGIKPMALLNVGLGVSLLVQLAIVLDLGPARWLWPLMGLVVSVSPLAYSQLAVAFPVSVSGRVNSALNLMIFVGAFGLQWGIGAVVEAFAAGGMTRANAFVLSFAWLLAAQAVVYLWFLLPAQRPPAP
jgi:hypothetical protein